MNHSHTENLKTLDQLQSALAFVTGAGLTQYVKEWTFTSWCHRIDMDKADIPDDVFRNLKRLFGKKNDAGMHTLEVTGGAGYRRFTGARFLNEGTSREFSIDLNITNAMVCQEVEVNGDTTDEEMAVIIRRIKAGEIPVTVCDVVKYHDEIAAETTASA